MGRPGWILWSVSACFFGMAYLNHILEGHPPRGPCLGLSLGFACFTLLRPQVPGLWLAAAFLALARTPTPADPKLDWSPRVVEFQARVIAHEPDAWQGKWLRVDRIHQARFKSTLRVRVDVHPLPQIGSTVLIRARAECNRGRVQLRQARVQELEMRSSLSFLERLRLQVRNRLERALPDPHARLARALLLGQRHASPGELRELYREFGLLHLLTVSGMHLFVWSWLLSRVLPRPIGWLRWPILVLLTALASFGPAVTRAASALAIREGLARLGCAVPFWTVWSLTLWLELAQARSQVIQVSSLLSFGATLAVLLGVRLARTRVQRVLLPSAGAFAVTAPIVHLWQGTVEPWSIPLTPIVGLLLPIRLLAAGLAALPGMGLLASGLLTLTEAVESVVLSVASYLPATPWAAFHMSSLAVLLCSLLGFGLLLPSHRVRAASLCLFLATPMLTKRAQAVAGFVPSGTSLILVHDTATHVMVSGERPQVSLRDWDRFWAPALRQARAASAVMIHTTETTPASRIAQHARARGLRVKGSDQAGAIRPICVWIGGQRMTAAFTFEYQGLSVLALPCTDLPLLRALLERLPPRCADVIAIPLLPQDSIAFTRLLLHCGAQTLWLGSHKDVKDWNRRPIAKTVFARTKPLA